MHPVVSQYGDAITPIKKMLYEEPELFKVESTGVTVTLDSSVDLISRYCEKLPKDKYVKVFSINNTISLSVFLTVACYVGIIFHIPLLNLTLMVAVF